MAVLELQGLKQRAARLGQLWCSHGERPRRPGPWRSCCLGVPAGRIWWAQETEQGQRCRGRETLGLTGPRLRVWTPHSLGCVDGQLCSQGSGWLTAAASFISLHQGWDRRRARSPLQGSSAFAEDAECIPPPAGCTMLHAMCVWPWWDCQPERLQRKAKVRLKNTLRIQGNQNI